MTASGGPISAWVKSETRKGKREMTQRDRTAHGDWDSMRRGGAGRSRAGPRRRTRSKSRCWCRFPARGPSRASSNAPAPRWRSTTSTSAGGIKSLGGAKLKLLALDTGATAETAKDAAQRMISRPPQPCRRDRLLAFDVHAGRDRGQRARRAAVAYAVLFRRDHRPRLQIRLPDLADRQRAGRADRAVSDEAAQAATGKAPTKVAIIGDNTAASVSFMKPIPTTC